MRYQPFPSELFVKNRAKLVSELPPKSIALISSNDIMPTNADGSMGFKQQTDIFYLSGLDQEETLLLIYPDAPEQHLKEINTPKKKQSQLVELKIFNGQVILKQF